MFESESQIKCYNEIILLSRLLFITEGKYALRKLSIQYFVRNIMLPRRFMDLFGSDYQPHSICAIS